MSVTSEAAQTARRPRDSGWANGSEGLKSIRRKLLMRPWVCNSCNKRSCRCSMPQRRERSATRHSSSSADCSRTASGSGRTAQKRHAAIWRQACCRRAQLAASSTPIPRHHANDRQPASPRQKTSVPTNKARDRIAKARRSPLTTSPEAGASQEKGSAKSASTETAHPNSAVDERGNRRTGGV